MLCTESNICSIQWEIGRCNSLDISGLNIFKDIKTQRYSVNISIFSINLERNMAFNFVQSQKMWENFIFLLSSRDGAFSGLDSLEWLKLEDNAITALAGEQLFPPTLKVTQEIREDRRIGKRRAGQGWTGQGRARPGKARQLIERNDNAQRMQGRVGQGRKG